MRAFMIEKYAHPSKIPLTLDAPEPTAAPDQVLVDVYSAGLNFFDVRTPPCSLVSTTLTGSSL